MATQQFHEFHPYRTAPDPEADAELGGLTVPFAGQTRMRLTITSGMADARVWIDPDATDLIAVAHGEGIAPRLRVTSSELRLSWPASIGSWLRAALTGEQRDLEIVLHPAVEWILQIRGGLSHFEADLAAGKLARLEISGGVSNASFDLPAPAGVVPLRISGGACNLALRRPAAIGVGLAVNGGISALRLDDQAFDAIGGGARLATGPVHDDTPRYALEINGGASGLQVFPRWSGVQHR